MNDRLTNEKSLQLLQELSQTIELSSEQLIYNKLGQLEEIEKKLGAGLMTVFKALEEGFNRYPTFSYFFPRLIDAYSQEGELEKALQVTDKAIEACDTCSLYYFAKSTILLRFGRYQDCIDVCKRLLSFCPELAEVYFNAGTSYINLALELDERKDKKKIRQLYQEALPYMEQYRRLAPKELEKWGSPLYRIYFNLNMGKQFDEIDRLLKQ